MSSIRRTLGVVAALAGMVAGSAQAATYAIGVQFPDDKRAAPQPVVLDLADQGRPQSATSPDGTFVAVYAQHAVKGTMLEAAVNVIDHVDTSEKAGTGAGTVWLVLGRPETLRSPAGAHVVLTLQQIRP